MNFGILDANSWKLNYFQKKSTFAMGGKLVCYWNQMSRTFLNQHFKTTSELGLGKAFIKAPNAEYFICSCSSASSCPTWQSPRLFVPPGHKTTRGTSRNLWETSLGAIWRGILDFSRKLIFLWKWQSWQVSPAPLPHSYCQMQLFPHKPPKPTAILKTDMSMKSPVRESYLYI